MVINLMGSLICYLLQKVAVPSNNLAVSRLRHKGCRKFSIPFYLTIYKSATYRERPDGQVSGMLAGNGKRGTGNLRDPHQHVAVESDVLQIELLFEAILIDKSSL